MTPLTLLYECVCACVCVCVHVRACVCVCVSVWIQTPLPSTILQSKKKKKTSHEDDNGSLGLVTWIYCEEQQGHVLCFTDTHTHKHTQICATATDPELLFSQPFHSLYINIHGNSKLSWSILTWWLSPNIRCMMSCVCVCVCVHRLPKHPLIAISKAHSYSSSALYTYKEWRTEIKINKRGKLKKGKKEKTK